MTGRIRGSGQRQPGPEEIAEAVFRRLNPQAVTVAGAATSSPLARTARRLRSTGARVRGGHAASPDPGRGVPQSTP